MEIRSTHTPTLRPDPNRGDQVPRPPQPTGAAAVTSPAAMSEASRVMAAFQPPVPVTQSLLSPLQSARATAKDRAADVIAQQGYVAARRLMKD